MCVLKGILFAASILASAAASAQGVSWYACFYSTAVSGTDSIGFEEPAYVAGGTLPSPWIVAHDGHWEVSTQQPASGLQCLALGCYQDEYSISVVETRYPLDISSATKSLDVDIALLPTAYAPGTYDPGFLSNGAITVYTGGTYVIGVEFETVKPASTPFEASHRKLTASFDSLSTNIQREMVWVAGYYGIHVHFDYTNMTATLRIEPPAGDAYEETVSDIELPGGSNNFVRLFGSTASLDYISARANFDDLTISIDTGVLVVNIEPAEAREDGVMWCVDGGAWQYSGASVSGLSEGEHTVTFKPVGEWELEPMQITIQAGKTTTETAGPLLLPISMGALAVVVMVLAIAGWRMGNAHTYNHKTVSVCHRRGTA